VKFKTDRRSTSIAIYVFLVVAASILFYECVINFPYLMGRLSILFAIIQPVIFGFVIAYLLNPVLRLFDDKLLPKLSKGKILPRPRRIIAMLLTYTTAIFLISGFISVVIPQVAQSVENLIGNIPEYMRIMQEWFSGFSQRNTWLFSADTGTVTGSLMTTLLSNLSGILEGFYAFLAGMVPEILTAGAQFTANLLNLCFGFVISIYFLLDREKLLAQFRKLITAILPDKASKGIYGCMIIWESLFARDAAIGLVALNSWYCKRLCLHVSIKVLLRIFLSLQHVRTYEYHVCIPQTKCIQYVTHLLDAYNWIIGP
jgi:predicted PurR-regulated permease PerM